MLWIGEPAESSRGLWSVGIHPGHADELLAALDPTVPFVIIECGNPTKGWHDAPVMIGPESTPAVRRVRSLHFDLLVDPAGAMEIGPLLRRQHDGSLHAFHLRREPAAHFRLPPPERGMAQAMTGLGVLLKIDLPHDGEIANISATDPETLHAFTQRFRRARHRPPRGTPA